MGGLQIYMIGLIVEDMGASLAFYQRLGLDVPSDTDSTHVEIEMAGGMMLFIDSSPHAGIPGSSHPPIGNPGHTEVSWSSISSQMPMSGRSSTKWSTTATGVSGTPTARRSTCALPSSKTLMGTRFCFRVTPTHPKYLDNDLI